MLVRMKKGRTTFEVIVEEGMVAKYRDGSVKNLDEVVSKRTIFTDAGMGKKASSEELNAGFGTDDVGAVLELIVQKGDAQESAGERKEKFEAKRQEIITTIQKNYISPDGHPLPAQRVSNALEKVKPRIDVEVDAVRQVTAMFAKLSAVMPMKKTTSGMEGTVAVPTSLAGVVSGTVRKHATVHRETYGDKAKFDVDIHSYDLLMKDLARVTKGDFEFTLSTDGAAAAPANEAAPASNRKRKGKKRGK